MRAAGSIDRVNADPTGSALTTPRGAIYVDATLMMPTLKKEPLEPAGISRAAFEVVSSILLGASGSQLLVADPYAGQVRAYHPAQRSGERGLLEEMSRIARAMPRSRVQQARTWVRTSFGRKPWSLPSEFERISDRDVVLFHGMNIKRGFLEAMKRARRRHGMKVALYLHDMLPLTHPQYTAGREQEFRAYITAFMDGCDLLLTSSRYNAAAFPNAVARITDRPLPTIAVVPLAHEYRPWQSGLERPAVPGLADDAFVLCVGKIEPRKNQLGLLRAWQRYRSGSRRPSAAHLVLAGTLGARATEVVEFLERTGRCDGTVHLVPSPSDPELTWLYANCRFTAYVSFAEGFGLPIGESLWLGKTCMASRTTSMPEVGGDRAVYVDPESIDEMAATLHRMLDEEGYVDRLNQKISRSELRTWGDFQHDLVDAVRSCSSN
jgi:glycosyltransferase involved in cell wall biosynthesis